MLSNEDNVGGSLSQDPYNTNAEKASSGFDVTHRFVSSAIYELPFGKTGKLLGDSKVARAALGGWQLGGIFVAQGGHPITFGVSPNPSNSTTPERPNRVCDGNLSGDQRTVDSWFQVSCFALPANFTYGNSARGAVRSPGLVNVDALVGRNFALTEKYNLEFRAEAFNLSNSVHFAAPGNTIGTPTAGKITATASPNRQIQFALRFRF